MAVIGVSTSANISAALTLAIGRCLIKLSLAFNGVLINRRLILVLEGEGEEVGQEVPSWSANNFTEAWIPRSRQGMPGY